MANFIGCSGWSYKEWRGEFYPEGLPITKWLEFYAQKFSTVEINATFYRLPSPASMSKWFRNVPEHFKFSLKLPGTITHYKKFHDVENELSYFYELAQMLGPKLGIILVQLPPSFTFSEKNFDAISEALDYRFQHAVEFRHRSWFSQEAQTYLKKFRGALCDADYTIKPLQLVMSSINKRKHRNIYIRCHGPSALYSSDYDTEQLQDVVQQLRAISYDNLWAYFNNTMHSFANRNAQTFIELLR